MRHSPMMTDGFNRFVRPRVVGFVLVIGRILAAVRAQAEAIIRLLPGTPPVTATIKPPAVE
jgi:hypothetical protein